MRQRQIAVVVASVALAASAALTHRAVTEVPPPAAADTITPTGGGNQALTYAEDQTIHLGNRRIKTGVEVLSLDVTDDGAAFTTFDGLLWFTDGRTVTQIGLTTPGRVIARGVGWSPAGRPNDRIVADYDGSRLAWLEYTSGDQHTEPPELVVYDSRERRRVARVPLRPTSSCPSCAHIVSVHGDHVDWTNGSGKGLGTSMQRQSSTRLYRYDLSTGRQTSHSVESYQAELRRRPRTLVVGDSLVEGTVGDAIGQDFVLVDRSLVAGGRGTGKKTYDPRTGRRITFRAPPSLWKGFGGQRFYLFQWLDDDTVALLAGTGWDRDDRPDEDVLLCSLSSGRCRVALRQGATNASPVVPEFETPGADHAQARAARAQVLSGR